MKLGLMIPSIVFAAMSFGAQAGLVEGDWRVDGDKKLRFMRRPG